MRSFKRIKVELSFYFCLQSVDLKLVDFSKTDNKTGVNIFRALMNQGYLAYHKLKLLALGTKSLAEYSKMISWGQGSAKESQSQSQSQLKKK